MQFADLWLTHRIYNIHSDYSKTSKQMASKRSDDSNISKNATGIFNKWIRSRKRQFYQIYLPCSRSLKSLNFDSSVTCCNFIIRSSFLKSQFDIEYFAILTDSISFPLQMISLAQIYDNVKVLVDFTVILIQFVFEIIYSLIRKLIKDKPKDVSGEIVLVNNLWFTANLHPVISNRNSFVTKFSRKITGTGHGIGKELALQYTALGCQVICVDINEVNNNKVVDEANSLQMGTAYGYK